VLIQTWPEAIEDTKAATETIPNPTTKPTIVQDMKNRASACTEPFKSIWQAIPDDALVSHNRLTDWPTEPWDNRNGTVTLAGDAAHPMTFRECQDLEATHKLTCKDRGQGLNNAISDACTLPHALENHYPPSDTDADASPSPFAKALEVYERDVWERGREAVLSSTKNTMMMHDWKTVAQSAAMRVGITVPQDLDESGSN